MKIIQNDGIREWQIEESRNLMVSAYNVQTGHLISKTARKDIKQKIYPPKTQDKGPIPESMSKTSYSTDTELIDIKLSITVIASLIVQVRGGMEESHNNTGG